MVRRSNGAELGVVGAADPLARIHPRLLSWEKIVNGVLDLGKYVPGFKWAAFVQPLNVSSFVSGMLDLAKYVVGFEWSKLIKPFAWPELPKFSSPKIPALERPELPEISK